MLDTSKELIKLQMEAELDTSLESLRQPGISYVPGVGLNYYPDVMFVGEAPGPMENAKGLPFYGPAGKVFTGLIDNAGIDISKVYITNAVKYMPVKLGTQDFRKPTLEEVRSMVPYLAKEIALIKPLIICLMGNSAISAFYTNESVRKLRGKLVEYVASEDFPPFNIFVTYHPSVLQYMKELKPLLEQDFKMLAAFTKTD